MLVQHGDRSLSKRLEECINALFFAIWILLKQETVSGSGSASVKFNSSFDTDCLKFKVPADILAGCLSKLSNFGRKSYNFD